MNFRFYTSNNNPLITLLNTLVTRVFFLLIKGVARSHFTHYCIASGASSIQDIPAASTWYILPRLRPGLPYKLGRSLSARLAGGVPPLDSPNKLGKRVSLACSEGWNLTFPPARQPPSICVTTTFFYSFRSFLFMLQK